MQEHQIAHQNIAQSIHQSTKKQAQWLNLNLNIIGGQTTLITDIGLEAGLFQAIDQSGSSGIDEFSLAKNLGFAPRYVQVWCQAAYAFKLLELDEESNNYRLTPDMASLLLYPHDPLFMGGRIRVLAGLYEDFQLFPQYLRSGEVLQGDNHKSYILEALTDMTNPDFEMITETVLPQADGILTKLDQGGAILDIGMGTGASLIHYSKRFPKAQIFGIDFDPSAVKLSQRHITEAGLASRIIIRQDDVNSIRDRCIYDLITMNLVLHETGGPSEYRNVLRRVRQALKPGGIVVVSELPYPDSVSEYRNKPLFQMLAGLQIHEALSGGGKITKGELRELLEETGFSHVRVANQPFPYRFVMLAEKQG